MAATPHAASFDYIVIGAGSAGMPTVVSGNTNAAVVMIAEKGADMILQDAAAEAPVSMQRQVG